jgi:site-specific recombinase XerD
MATIKVRKYNNSVYVIYSHGNKKLKIFTGAKVDDKYWNINALKRNCPDYNLLKSQIDAMQNQVLNASISVRQKGLDPMPELVRIECKLRAASVLENADLESIWVKYRKFLDQMACRESTKRRVSITYNVIKFFCRWSGYDFDASTFNKMILGQIIHYLLHDQKLADATVLKHVKCLKTFLKTAYPEMDWSWVKYSMLFVESEVLTLTEEELNKLIDAKLTGYLSKTRDLFIFMATTGMRHCDSQLYDQSWETPEQVLEFIQLKTGGKAYPPLYYISRSILEHYGGKPPRMTNQKLNAFLKQLFRQLNFDRRVTIQEVKGKQVFRTSKPLYEAISSHAARKTFITICLQKGMPIQDVMKMSGHSDFKSMKPYMRITRKDIRAVADRWDI